jgi:hypothetical protein
MPVPSAPFELGLVEQPTLAVPVHSSPVQLVMTLKTNLEGSNCASRCAMYHSPASVIVDAT